MRRFAAGIGVALILVLAAAGVWIGLDDQAQGIVIGLLFGIGGVAVGIILALAVVAIFLLYNLRWSVNASRPPVVIDRPAPALPAPQQQFYPAPGTSWRKPRDWLVLGAEDVEAESQR